MHQREISKAVLVLVTGFALVLAGCDTSKPSVNEETMGAAVNKYLAANGELCLSLNKWPVEVSEHETDHAKMLPYGLASQMAALAIVGLVTETQGEVDQLVGNKPTGRKFKVRTFQLTDEGKKFWRPDAVPHAALAGANPKVKGDLCYGTKTVAKVVKLDALPESGADKEFNVRYLYRVDGLAEWAKRPEFQKAFPGPARIINEAEKKQATHGVKVTALGLIPRGLHDI